MREQAKTLFCALSDVQEEFLEELAAGQEPAREIKRPLWRRLAAAGVAVAVLFVLAVGANAAGGRLFEEIGKIWGLDQPAIEFTTEVNGNVVGVALGIDRDTLMTFLWQLKKEGSAPLAMAVALEGEKTVTLETITLEELLDKFGQESISMTVEYTGADGQESHRVEETMTLEELLDRLEGPGKLRPAEKEKTP